MRPPVPNLRTGRFLSTIANDRRRKQRIDKAKKKDKKKNICSSSSSPIDSLANDLMVNIISRLPIRYLLRCQLVSKSWRSLIADDIIPRSLPTSLLGFFYYPRIVRLSAKIVAKPPNFPIFQPIGSPAHSISEDSLPSKANLKVIDCCNGLLLCHSSGRGRHKSMDYYVVNPITKMWQPLPKPPRKSFLYLAFEPLVSPHYKVLCLKRGKHGFPEYHILTSNIWQWGESWQWGRSRRLARCGWSHLSISGRQHGMFCKGAFYIATTNWILIFRLKGRQYREIDLPDGAMKPGMGTAIGRLAGTVCYADLRGPCIRVWALEGDDDDEDGDADEDGDGDKWVLKHKAVIQDLEQLRIEGHSKPYKVHIFAFHPHEEVVFILMRNRVLSYDLNSMVLKEICKLQSDDGYQAFQATGFAFSPCLFDAFRDDDEETIYDDEDLYDEDFFSIKNHPLFF